MPRHATEAFALEHAGKTTLPGYNFDPVFDIRSFFDLQGQTVFYYVRPNGQDTRAGTTPATAFATVKEALRRIPKDFINGTFYVDVTGCDLTERISIPPYRSNKPVMSQVPRNIALQYPGLSYEGAVNIVAKHTLVEDWTPLVAGIEFVAQTDHQGGLAVRFDNSSFASLDISPLLGLPAGNPIILQLSQVAGASGNACRIRAVGDQVDGGGVVTADTATDFTLHFTPGRTLSEMRTVNGLLLGGSDGFVALTPVGAGFNEVLGAGAVFPYTSFSGGQADTLGGHYARVDLSVLAPNIGTVIDWKLSGPRGNLDTLGFAWHIVDGMSGGLNEYGGDFTQILLVNGVSTVASFEAELIRNGFNVRVPGPNPDHVIVGADFAALLPAVRFAGGTGRDEGTHAGRFLRYIPTYEYSEADNFCVSPITTSTEGNRVVLAETAHNGSAFGEGKPDAAYTQIAVVEPSASLRWTEDDVGVVLIDGLQSPVSLYGLAFPDNAGIKVTNSAYVYISGCTVANIHVDRGGVVLHRCTVGLKDRPESFASNGSILFDGSWVAGSLVMSTFTSSDLAHTLPSSSSTVMARGSYITNAVQGQFAGRKSIEFSESVYAGSIYWGMTVRDTAVRANNSRFYPLMFAFEGLSSGLFEECRGTTGTAPNFAVHGGAVTVAGTTWNPRSEFDVSGGASGNYTVGPDDTVLGDLNDLAGGTQVITNKNCTLIVTSPTGV